MSFNQNFSISFRNSLACKLILYILCFSSIVTLMLTSLQLYLDYARDVRLIEERLQQIKTSYLESITTGLWVSNEKLLRVQLEGILRLPDIQYLSIQSDELDSLQVGEYQSEFVIRRKFALTYEYRNQQVFLGDLLVIASLEGVYTRLIDKAIVILITQGVKTLLVSTFIFFIFYVLVGKHLADISAYTLKLGPETSGPPLQLLRKVKSGQQIDELEQLTASINEMRKRLQEKIAALQESESKFHDAFQYAPIGFCLTSLDGVFLQVNLELCQMLGYTAEELLGKPFQDITHPHDQKQSMEQVHDTLSGQAKRIRFEKRYLHKNGQVIWGFVSAALQLDVEANPLYFITQIVDITGRKKVELELRTHREHLEDLVRQRTSALEHSNEELRATLEHLEHAQSQLIEVEKMASLGQLVAGVAHEVNTPLGIGVTGMSHQQLLLRELRSNHHSGKLTRTQFEKSLKKMEEISEIIFHNMQVASKIINEFKQIAVDQSFDIKTTVELKQYLELTLHTLTPKLKQQNPTINVHCDEQLELYSYPGAIAQVLTNLVTNSLLHGFEQGFPGEINIDVTSEQDDITLQYSDNGQGIPAVNLKKIFDPFFTTKRGQGGSGLGLHIIYNLITQKLRGSIHCHSQVGQGTTFVIKLPRKLD